MGPSELSSGLKEIFDEILFNFVAILCAFWAIYSRNVRATAVVTNN
jgi:hypothetical protein